MPGGLDPDWVDPFVCPGCGATGTPQERRNGVFIMACEEWFGCDYDDQWKVNEADVGDNWIE
jgi:hypothetical protein